MLWRLTQADDAARRRRHAVRSESKRGPSNLGLSVGSPPYRFPLLDAAATSRCSSRRNGLTRRFARFRNRPRARLYKCLHHQRSRVAVHSSARVEGRTRSEVFAATGDAPGATSFPLGGKDNSPYYQGGQNRPDARASRRSLRSLSRFARNYRQPERARALDHGTDGSSRGSWRLRVDQPSRRHPPGSALPPRATHSASALESTRS